MTQIKAILFDFGGTLFDFSPSNYEILGSVARRHGKDIEDSDPMLSQAFQAQELYIQHLFESRNISFQGSLSKEDWLECDRILLKTVGIHNNTGAMGDLIETFSKRMFQYQLYPDTLPTLKLLHQQGYKLGIISNLGNQKQISRRYKMLKDYGMFDLMDTIILSGEHPVAKPDPAIFKLAMQHIPEILINEALYVGDSYLFDVIGARKAGLKPLLLDRNLGKTFDCDIVSKISDLPEYLEKINV